MDSDFGHPGWRQPLLPLLRKDFPEQTPTTRILDLSDAKFEGDSEAHEMVVATAKHFVQSISLRGSALTCETSKGVAASLRGAGHCLTSIDMIGNSMDQECAEALMQAVQANGDPLVSLCGLSNTTAPNPSYDFSNRGLVGDISGMWMLLENEYKTTGAEASLEIDISGNSTRLFQYLLAGRND